MPKVIAKAEIHRTIKPGKAATATSPAVKPEIEIIAPGTAFVAEGEELAALRRSRAIRDPEETVKADPPVVAEDAPAPAAATKKGKSTATRSRKTAKPKNEPAASDDEDKTSTDDEGKNDGDGDDGDNGAGDDGEGTDTESNLV